MSEVADAFRRCLEDLDVALMRRLWSKFIPHFEQPSSDADALMMMHHARTQAESVSFTNRAYSHSWLRERGFPSGLPDELKPRAERLYPRVVTAVGISVNASSPEFKPAALIIRRSMEDAVNECYADGVEDPTLVKKRMDEARIKTIDKLYG
jgi:hypothetical protein